MADEDLVLDPHSFADEGVALDLAGGADLDPALDLDEGADPGAVADPAAVEIREGVDDDVRRRRTTSLSRRCVPRSAGASRGSCHDQRRARALGLRRIPLQPAQAAACRPPFFPHVGRSKSVDRRAVRRRASRPGRNREARRRGSASRLPSPSRTRCPTVELDGPRRFRGWTSTSRRSSSSSATSTSRRDDRACAGSVAKRARPSIVVVSPPATGAGVRRTLDAGADALVFDSELELTLAATLHAVVSGQSVVPRKLRASVERPNLLPSRAPGPDPGRQGLTNAEIAERLYLAESTVKSHLASIFTKFGVHSRKEAAAVFADLSCDHAPDPLRDRTGMSNPRTGCHRRDRTATRVPFTRLDNADPELLARAARGRRRRRRRRRLHPRRRGGAASSGSSPPGARPSTRSGSPPAPRRWSWRCAASGSARATRSSSPPTASSPPPRRSAPPARRRAWSTSTRRPRCSPPRSSKRR